MGTEMIEDGVERTSAGEGGTAFDPDRDIAEAQTPPADWYASPETFDEERRSVFRHRWIAAARSGQLRSPGDYVAGNLAGEPYLILRDADGGLRALSNVCRHHAACILDGEGSAEELVCPYHGWSYRLDGGLKSAPRMAGVKRFDREQYGLPSFEAVEKGPFVFVRIATPAGEDREAEGPLYTEIEGRLRAADFQSLRFFARRSYQMDCNWKVFVDNYLDGGYHVGHLHHRLAAKLDLDSYRTELFARSSLQTCVAGGSAGTRIGAGALYAWLYPNFMINRYGPFMDTNLVLPLDPRSCVVIFDYFLDDSASQGEDELREALEASHQVQVEDMAICESVQAGLASRAYDTGRYAPSVEAAAYHFHRLLVEDLDHAAGEAGGRPRG